MNDWTGAAEPLTRHLELSRPPVGIAFPEAAPPGIPERTDPVPSTCTFWRLALDEGSFWTRPERHLECPIGAHTHGIPVPAERRGELGDTVRLMCDAGYLREGEAEGIPRRSEAPRVLVHGPLAEMPIPPDVVLMTAAPRGIRRLLEAAIRAGYDAPPPLLSRPTCMAVPISAERPLTVSAGCIGNRVYTDAPDDLSYAFLRGDAVVPIAGSLDTVDRANRALEAYHRDRRRSFETS